MARTGARLREGLDVQARSHGFAVHQSGPVQSPVLYFTGDKTVRVDKAWPEAAVRNGVYLHPWHSRFLSAAHTDEHIDAILDRTNAAFVGRAAKQAVIAETGSYRLSA